MTDTPITPNRTQDERLKEALVLTVESLLDVMRKSEDSPSIDDMRAVTKLTTLWGQLEMHGSITERFSKRIDALNKQVLDLETRAEERKESWRCTAWLVDGARCEGRIGHDGEHGFGPSMRRK